MIHNGFFYQENAHDQVKIKLGISKSERLYAMKAEVLAQAGIPVYVQLSTIVEQLVSQVHLSHTGPTRTPACVLVGFLG